jgi:hypothetical protein
MKDKCEHGMPPKLCAVCTSKRNREEFEQLAALVCKTVKEVERDLCAPDPKEE